MFGWQSHLYTYKQGSHKKFLGLRWSEVERHRSFDIINLLCTFLIAWWCNLRQKTFIWAHELRERIVHHGGSMEGETSGSCAGKCVRLLVHTSVDQEAEIRQGVGSDYKPQGPPPKIHFLHLGSTSQRLYNLPTQCHQVETKCSSTGACKEHFISR